MGALLLNYITLAGWGDLVRVPTFLATKECFQEDHYK